MRIEQLEYLAAIARLGSFRRAAEELHISQPALSGSVRSLERELGVDVLERGRYGARMSDPGRDLFPYILTVLDAVDRLRTAADEQHRSVRVVRVGTVNAATAPLLTPAIRQFRQSHPATQVEVVGAQQADIHRGLLAGNFDLGLVSYLDGDDRPPELETTLLLTGHAVVCMRPDSPLAGREAIRAGDLLAEPLIVMRSGYVMHRYVHRLLHGQAPALSYSTDGAEMGKLMVAEGLGLTVLPDFSVIGDPLEQRKVITWRPLADDGTKIHLVLQRARSASPPRAARDLQDIFVARARAYSGPGRPARSGSRPGRPDGEFPHDLRPGADRGRARAADGQRGRDRRQPDGLRHRAAQENLDGQRGRETVTRPGSVHHRAGGLGGELGPALPGQHLTAAAAPGHHGQPAVIRHPGQQLAQVRRLQLGHHHDVDQWQHGRGKAAWQQPDQAAVIVPAPDQALRGQADQPGQARAGESLDRDFLCNRRDMQNIAVREIVRVNLTGPRRKPLFARIIF